MSTETHWVGYSFHFNRTSIGKLPGILYIINNFILFQRLFFQKLFNYSNISEILFSVLFLHMGCKTVTHIKYRTPCLLDSVFLAF